ncbi:MAG: hypothetical protein KDK39_08810 [Leptospiraceae bacterium]|nr:hypothetical protein [Leptospiraceae bacterium]
MQPDKNLISITQKRTAFIFTILTAVTLNSGCYFFPRETFARLQAPALLLLANPDKTIPILKQPLKKEMLDWSNRKAPALQVDGVLRVDYKGQYYDYLQLICPPQLPCSGAKAYVPLALTRAYGAPAKEIEKINKGSDDREKNTQIEFLIVPVNNPSEGSASGGSAPAASSAYPGLRDWLHNPRRPIPEVFDFNFIQDHLATMTESEREAKLTEWFFLAESYVQKMRNPAFRPFIVHYGNFNKVEAVLKGANPDDAGLGNAQDQFLKDLAGFARPRFDGMLERYYRSLLEMARQGSSLEKNLQNYARLFNTRLQKPLFKEYFFQQLLEATEYENALLQPADSPFYKEYFDAWTAKELKGKPEAELVSTDLAAGKFIYTIDDQERTGKVPDPFQGTKPKVQFDYEFGGILKWTTAGQNREAIIATIRAEADGLRGIKFIVDTDTFKGLELRPVKLAPYFEDLNEDKFKRLAASLGSLDELLATKNFRQRALLTAIKLNYKEITFDEKKRMHSIRLGPEHFSALRDLLKSYKSIGVLDKSTYSGPVEHWNANSNLRWFQKVDSFAGDKRSSLRLGGTIEYCQRECFTEKLEDVYCLRDFREDWLVVRFAPGAWEDEDPDGERIELELHLDVNTVITNADVTKEVANSHYCASAWREIDFYRGDKDRLYAFD